MNIKSMLVFTLLAFAQLSLADVTFTHTGGLENEAGSGANGGGTVLASGDTYTRPATNLWLSSSNQRVEVTENTTFIKASATVVGGFMPVYQVLVFASETSTEVLSATAGLGQKDPEILVNDISLAVTAGQWIAIRTIWKSQGGQTSVSVELEKQVIVATDTIEITGEDTMAVGDTVQFSATVLPANATNKNFVWGTTTSDILYVDILGNVAALKAGEGAVTATQGSDVYTFAVTVNDTSTGGGVSNWILNSNAQNRVVVYGLQGKLIAKMSEAKWNNTVSVQAESQLYLVRVYSHSGALLNSYKTLK